MVRLQPPCIVARKHPKLEPLEETIHPMEQVRLVQKRPTIHGRCLHFTVCLFIESHLQTCLSIGILLQFHLLSGQGGVPDSRIVVARSLHSAYYDGNTTWNTNDKFLESCGSEVNNHDSVSVQVTKKSLTGLDINHNEWRKNTVIKILSEGTLGVLQSKIGKDGIVDVRRMEGGRLTNDFKKYHYESIAPATPYTECFVEVMTGKYKGMEGRVTSITGCDVFIGESRNLFRLQHLLWKFVDSK